MIPIWKQISGPRKQGGLPLRKEDCLFRRHRLSGTSPRAGEYAGQHVDLNPPPSHSTCTLRNRTCSKHVCSSLRRNARRPATTLTLHGGNASVFVASNGMNDVLQVKEATAAWPLHIVGVDLGTQLPLSSHSAPTRHPIFIIDYILWWKGKKAVSCDSKHPAECDKERCCSASGVPTIA